MRRLQSFTYRHFFKMVIQFIVFSFFLSGLNTAYAAKDINAELDILKEQYQQSIELNKKSMALILELSKKVEQLEKRDLAVVKSKTIEEERVEELEDIVSDLEESIGSRAIVKAFDALEVNIGGIFISDFTYVDAEDGEEGAFNRQNFELLISAQLNESWSAFFAAAFALRSDDPFETGSRLEPEFNNRSLTPEILSWVNYQYSDAFNLRIGRFTTPHGIINIEHFPITLLSPLQPQFLRPMGGNTLFANFSNGLHAHGKQFIGDDIWSYNAYVSAFVGNPEDEIFGAMTEYTVSSYGLTAGVNYAHGSRSDGSEYDMGGIHVLLDKGSLLWKNELFITTGDSDNSDRLAFYTQPAWRITPQWIAFYRFDYLDNGVSVTTENVFGINYLPYSNIRLRALYTYKDFDRGIDANGNVFPGANANIFQFGGTFSF